MNTRRGPAASASPAAFSVIPGLPVSSMARVLRKLTAYSWMPDWLATSTEVVRFERRLRRDHLGHANGHFWPD